MLALSVRAASDALQSSIFCNASFDTFNVTKIACDSSNWDLISSLGLAGLSCCPSPCFCFLERILCFLEGLFQLIDLV